MASNGNIIIDRAELDGYYTVVENSIFYDRELSLKAVGLLCQLLSLPEGFTITIEGLAALKSDGPSAVKSALRELQAHGYLTVERRRGADGRLGDSVYRIHRDPKNLVEAMRQRRSEPETADTQTDGQLTWDDVDTPTMTPGKPARTATRHKHGEYQHVRLTDDELSRLIEDYGEQTVTAAIRAVDEYCETSGKRYKNYNLTIRNWGVRAAQEALKPATRPAGGHRRQAANPFLDMLQEGVY